MAINTVKRYCGLCGITIEDLTDEQSKAAIRWLQDYKFNDENNDDLTMNIGFYRSDKVVNKVTSWDIVVFMHESSYNIAREMPWFAGESISSMYINFRERDKRFNLLIEDLLSIIKSV